MENSESTISFEPSTDAEGWKPFLLGALLVVVLTVIAFYRVPSLGWTNWDDNYYVYNNPAVTGGDYWDATMRGHMNAYTPLTMASFTAEWSVFSEDTPAADRAWLFHLDNLLLHIGCALLVLLIGTQLGLRVLWATAVAAIWAVHPLRVESVAWITERKDVLHGFFYLAALASYLRYHATERQGWLRLTFLLFVMALLSKVQAVTFPLVLLVVDWYQGRGLGWRNIRGKLSYVVLAVLVGTLTLVLLGQGGTLVVGGEQGWLTRLGAGAASYIAYILKSFVPYQASAFYPYPTALSVWSAICLVLSIGLGVAAILLRKRAPWFTFAISFYTVQIVFVLQIVGGGVAYQADRFAYLPSLGLYLGAMFWLQPQVERLPVLRFAGLGVSGLLVAVSIVLTMSFLPAWQNSETLWTDVIEKYPGKSIFSYVNRSEYYQENKRMDLAMNDLGEAINHFPDHSMSYVNRGNIYFEQDSLALAVRDYTKVIELNWPIDSTQRGNMALELALRNRGAALSRLNMLKEAIDDLSMALILSPGEVMNWSNRAVTYYAMGNYVGAINDFTTVLTLNPKDAASYNARGACYMMLDKKLPALQDFNMAVNLDPSQPNFYINRSRAFMALGNQAEAEADLARYNAFVDTTAE